eukprot:COSAG05_NODE_3500_length_2025_cov_1451.142783_2_plen_297_part_00
MDSCDASFNRVARQSRQQPKQRILANRVEPYQYAERSNTNPSANQPQCVTHRAVAMTNTRPSKLLDPGEEPCSLVYVLCLLSRVFRMTYLAVRCLQQLASYCKKPSSRWLAAEMTQLLPTCMRLGSFSHTGTHTVPLCIAPRKLSHVLRIICIVRPKLDARALQSLEHRGQAHSTHACATPCQNRPAERGAQSGHQDACLSMSPMIAEPRPGLQGTSVARPGCVYRAKGPEWGDLARHAGGDMRPEAVAPRISLCKTRHVGHVLPLRAHRPRQAYGDQGPGAGPARRSGGVSGAPE